MKIGVANPNLPEVYLPVEIISTIISHVALHGRVSDKQRTLWACCLTSKSWYAAAVAYLYRAPLLNNRNFDKFSRTICPPLTSRARKMGVENFVVRLDMEGLAYESSKSLTARLLRRSQHSLEVFVAPAVSFSIACLASLSKCYQLKYLDLSRDFYDVDLTQLLNAVKHLNQLHTLSLPKGTLRKQYVLRSNTSTTTPWPANLSVLQINDTLPPSVEKWEELISSFPGTLRTLICLESLDYNSLWLLFHCKICTPQLQSLIVGPPKSEDEFPLFGVLKLFPNLKSLAMPCSVLPYLLNSEDRDPTVGTSLERLDLRRSCNGESSVSIMQLQEYVKTFPRLKRIDLPESSLSLSEDATLDELEALQSLVERRAGSGSRSQSGIFLEES